jgi:hypothetical protein
MVDLTTPRPASPKGMAKKLGGTRVAAMIWLRSRSSGSDVALVSGTLSR